MKIKDGFILREIAESNIVVPVGSAQVDFNGIMTLNSVGVFVWKQLETETNEENIVKAVITEYDIDEQTAKHDVSVFLQKLKSKNIIED